MYLQRNTNSVLKRLLRKAIITLLVLGIPTLIFLFSFNVKKVVVEGSNHYTDKQIKQMLIKTKADYNSVLFYFRYHFITKPNIPFIEKFDVEMVNSHTVSVTVYEKKISGCVRFMGEYLYFDKDGIIVESSPDKIKNIPVIEGLRFNQVVLHQKLTVQNDTLYDEIMNLTNLVNKYKLDIDSISFSKTYDVTISCDGVNVLMGKKEYYDDVLSDLKNILQKSKGTRLYELDMRNYEKGSKYIIGKTKKTTE